MATAHERRALRSELAALMAKEEARRVVRGATEVVMKAPCAATMAGVIMTAEGGGGTRGVVSRGAIGQKRVSLRYKRQSDGGGRRRYNPKQDRERVDSETDRHGDVGTPDLVVCKVL